MSAQKAPKREIKVTAATAWITKLFRRRRKANLIVSETSPPGVGNAFLEEKPQGELASATVVQSDIVVSEDVTAPVSTAPEVLETPTTIVGITDHVEEAGSPLPGIAVAEDKEHEVLDAPAIFAEARESKDVEDQEIASSSDTVRTLERYQKAVENMKKALELRRDDWEHFELSQFDSIPFGDQKDIEAFQLQIDRVLESRATAVKDPTKSKKAKHVMESCFRALAPFLKNVLYVGQSASQVSLSLKPSH